MMCAHAWDACSLGEDTRYGGDDYLARVGELWGVTTVLEFSRILTAAAVVIASVGLLVYAMGASYYNPGSFEMNLGLVMMIGGVIGSVVGIIIYRQTTED